MNSALSPLTIRFSTTSSASYRVDLEGPDVGERRGSFMPPYTAVTWQAIVLALEPGFVLAEADKTVQAALKPLGDLAALPRTTGAALANALLADDTVRLGFDVALGRAEAMRRPLPVEMRFGAGCDALAALPWELLHYRDRFLLADTSIALSRYPEGAMPPTPALGELPLRVLLVLSEPVGASPIFPERAREELLHGLRTLDEAGAVVVDLLRPPTFSTLVEAVTNGGYHLLIFYGHGGYDPDSGGLLLFEDEFGGPALIKAAELGAALRNTDVRLVLLGACQSAMVADPSGLGNPKGLGVWSGTAPALVRAGVPLAIGMQVSMRVDAAQAFIRQFALSLAAGKPVIEAVADARKPIIRGAYGEMWYAPALYGRPAGDYRLFDPKGELPANTADLRAEMKATRSKIERLESAISGVRVLGQPEEIAHLRQAKARFAQVRAEVARRTSGGHAAVVSPLYGVPTNPIFVGRVQEMQQVGHGLTSNHPVVIWGTGGIGKSALAAEVAHRQSWRFPAGVLWLDCRGGPAFDSLLNQIGAFAGIEAIDKVKPDSKETTVKWALAGLDARCLLVWDNAEEVWDERAVRRFVEGLPVNCQALLTTRENPEQAMWPTVELGALSGQAMHDLFYRMATAAGVKAGSQADLDAIPLILDWLQGHPLALALVVPLAMKRGLRRVWTDLQGRPLKGIEAAFEVSFARLTDLQRGVFTRLSVYTIPFDWPAAQALLPGETGVDDALDTLVQRALVGFDGAHYAYHALLRQFAYEKLTAKGEAVQIHKLAAHYLEIYVTQDRQWRKPDQALEEIDQWEQAQEWERKVDRLAALVGSLDRVGYWNEISRRLDQTEASLTDQADPDSHRVAAVSFSKGFLAFKMGFWDEAADCWANAARWSETTDDRASLARAYRGLGNVHLEKYEIDKALEYYFKALDICKALNDSSGTAGLYNSLGIASQKNGELTQAVRYLNSALHIYEELADLRGIAWSYTNLGIAHIQTGDLSNAIEACQNATEFYRQTDDTYGIAQAQTNLSIAYADQGAFSQAYLLLKGVLGIYEQLGDLHNLAQSYINLGCFYARNEDWDHAIKSYNNAISLHGRRGDLFHLASGQCGLGYICLEKHDYTEARKYYEECLQIARRLENSSLAAEAYNGLAMVCHKEGRLDSAVEFWQCALQLGCGMDARGATARMHGNLGNVYTDKGEWDQALEHYEKSLELFESTGNMRDVAQTLENLGRYYQIRGKTDVAARHVALAYLIFEQSGISDAQRAAKRLTNILGSSDAATAYVSQLKDIWPRQSGRWFVSLAQVRLELARLAEA